MFFDTQCSLVTSSASLCNDLLLLSLVTDTISDLLLLSLMLVISDKMESLNYLKLSSARWLEILGRFTMPRKVALISILGIFNDAVY